MIIKLRELIQINNVDALLIYGKANKQYIQTLTGSGVWAIITDNHCYQLMDERYATEASTYNNNFESIMLKQGNNLEGVILFMKKLGINKIAIEENYLTVKDSIRLKKANLEVVYLNSSLEALRKIKTHKEIGMIKKACEITDNIYSLLLNRIQVGMSEKDIVCELVRLVYQHDVSGLSFEPVICSGIRTAMPHGRASNKKIEAGELLLIDFGIVYRGYQSDMTRTVGIGPINNRVRDMYQAVLMTQEQTINQCLVGNPCREIHLFAKDLITRFGYEGYFNHGLGHGLGLGHDEQPVFNEFSQDILEENMVFTCEPGIYIPQLGGIRIEDDIHLTASGPNYLTKSDRNLVILGG